jgi:hypothetical protein
VIFLFVPEAALALLAMLFTLSLVMGLTISDHKLLGRGGVLAGALMWVGMLILALLRMRWSGWSSEKTDWVTAAVLSWAVVSSLGRPAILLSRLFIDDSKTPQKLILRSIIGQVVLVIGIIAIVIVSSLRTSWR